LLAKPLLQPAKLQSMQARLLKKLLPLLMLLPLLLTLPPLLATLLLLLATLLLLLATLLAPLQLTLHLLHLLPSNFGLIKNRLSSRFFFVCSLRSIRRICWILNVSIPGWFGPIKPEWA